VGVVEEPAKGGGHGGDVAEQLPPVVDGAVRVMRVETRSYRRMTSSKRSSAAVFGSLRMPRSSMTRRGTVASSVKRSLRVPSRLASASSSSSTWASR
jgi:hypothetical protein